MLSTIPVLDDGFVRLVDVMGEDASITEAARVSTGSDNDDPERNSRLLRYLWREGHLSPFEMASMKFHIRAPLFVARQWFRHRTGKYNEESQRYKEIDGAFYVPNEWRLQSDGNKQGSAGYLRGDARAYQHTSYLMACDNAMAVYKQALARGVSREMARMVLPVSVYTEFFYKSDLRNLLHFTRLRSHEHAQWEIQQYARAINDFIQENFPGVWEAVNE